MERGRFGGDAESHDFSYAEAIKRLKEGVVESAKEHFQEGGAEALDAYDHGAGILSQELAESIDQGEPYNEIMYVLGFLIEKSQEWDPYMVKMIRKSFYKYVQNTAAAKGCQYGWQNDMLDQMSQRDMTEFNFVDDWQFEDMANYLHEQLDSPREN